MPKPRSRWVVIGLAVLCLLLSAPVGVWVALTHQPDFYRRAVTIPHAQTETEAKHFVEQSIQLSNDIINEPKWEAVFTDHEVNAWLAEDLLKSFADLVPANVHDPRVIFDMDRITAAFQVDRGSFTSVMWLVARVRVPEGNVLELTIEKMRVGALPLPIEQVLERVTRQARDRGLDVQWREDPDGPVATIRYASKGRNDDVVLERLNILEGKIVFSGRSNGVGAGGPKRLPNRRVLQSRFPRRNRQVQPEESGPESVLRSAISPAS